MREMTPTMSSSEGAPSVKVDEITYRGDVPMSPVLHSNLLTDIGLLIERGMTPLLTPLPT